MPEPVLCYIDNNVAYFTTQTLANQWGDDWNDEPYECNAGLPYLPCWHNQPEEIAKRGKWCDCAPCWRDWNPDGTPRWEVTTLMYTGEFKTPSEYLTWGISVQDINMGLEYAWLVATPHYGEPKRKHDYSGLMAGATVKEFVAFIRENGGEVYVPYREDET